MTALIYILAAAVILTAASFVIGRVSRTYVRLRGKRVISCPENLKPAAVELDAGHAALTSVAGVPELRLRDCSRWPERENCGQECLTQIERSPEDCLVRTILARWYEERNCVYCGKTIGEINWLDNKPALKTAEGITVQCTEVPAEMLPEVLSTHLPVCFDCHVAESFRRLYPDLVVDRHRRNHVDDAA